MTVSLMPFWKILNSALPRQSLDTIREKIRLSSYLFFAVLEIKGLIVVFARKGVATMRALRLLLALGVVFSLAAVSSAQQEKKAKKARDVEAVISDVGQRTITFQYDRKGKVREEGGGVDEKTDIEKEGAKLKLKDLQREDKVVIKYEPDAYTPALSVKVVGKGEVKKAGGGD